jgi:hypothetical protein
VKKQILLSPDTDSGSGSSEPVKRLASRYNIPEKDVEALLYGSRAPKSEASGSDIKGKSMADEFRSNYGAPQKQSGWSPVNVLSAIVGVLGIMALTIILISVIHRNSMYHMGGGMPPPPMMAPNPPHPAMLDSSSSAARREGTAMADKQEDAQKPSMTNEAESNPAAKPHYRIIRHSSPGFSTSNSVEAQERLAEMRADGNTKARVRQKTKNGVTIYNVK